MEKGGPRESIEEAELNRDDSSFLVRCVMFLMIASMLSNVSSTIEVTYQSKISNSIQSDCSFAPSRIQKMAGRSNNASARVRTNEAGS